MYPRIVSAYAKSKEEPHVVEEEQRYSILAQSKYVLNTHHLSAIVTAIFECFYKLNHACCKYNNLCRNACWISAHN